MTVRNEWLSSEMNREYFEIAASWCSKLDIGAKILLALTASSTVGGWTIWKDSTSFASIWHFASAAAAVTAVVTPFFRWAKKAEMASTLKYEYERTAKDYRALWLQRSEMDDSQLLKELQKVEAKENKLVAMEKNFREYKWLLALCKKRVEKRLGITP